MMKCLQMVALCVMAVLVAIPVWAQTDPFDHQINQNRPISLGTSGGNTQDISRMYCCSGTLGALVEDANGVQYVLSNNHVMGLSNQASLGDSVNHPGMIDQNCDTVGDVATFTALVPMRFSKGNKIKWNVVDAAIAQVIPGMVKPTGDILGIGPISSNTVAATQVVNVQKSGRTTGHTFGTILATDVTTSVGYSKECGGAANQIAYFQNQIRIGGADFSTSGDSGSLIVEAGSVDPETGLPRAVGLLFAGDSSSTLANPIDSVLSAFNVSMVGGIVAPPGPTGSIAGVVTNAEDGSPVDGATVSVGFLSDTTDAAGAYTVVDVPVGTVTVDVVATGYESASQTGVSVSENLTTVVDFALNQAQEPTISSPGCVTFDTNGGRFGDKNLHFAVLVVNDFGVPISGATVDISITRNGSAFGTGSGATTGSDGVVTYTARNAQDGEYVVTVTDISASGLTFSGASTTPTNSFVKGIDAVPSSFCADGISASGEAVSTTDVQTVDRARAAKARNRGILSGLPGVTGHGVGVGGDIEVYVLRSASPSDRAQIPTALDGVPVTVVETDGFIAY